MARRWESFHEPTTTAEFLSIPQPAQAALKYAMERYAKGQDVGWMVKDYGGGLSMLKPRNRTAGRCLFTARPEGGTERLIALLFYKKESDEAPNALIEAARKRMDALG